MLRAPRAAAAPCLAALILGCSGPPPAPPPPPARPPAPAPAPPPPARPSSFLLADPDALPAGSVVALGPEAPPAPRVPHASSEAPPPPSLGVLVQGERAVVDGAALRFAAEVAPTPLTHVHRIPPWLGSGFLFVGGGEVYTSQAFDGALRPLVALPGAIQSVSFGPRGLFLRSASGERWAIALPSGARQKIEPRGLSAIAAADDGRAAAITEGGGVVVSSDRGASWQDARGRVNGAPAEVKRIGGDVWILDDQGRGYRLDPGGKLTAFDRPPSLTPRRLRPLDPRWRGRDAPLRLAARAGALLDARTAVVAAAGDVAWIDLPSGALREIAAGVLPPDLACEAVEILPEGPRTPASVPPEDVIFVCGASGRPSVVLSGVVAAVPGGDEEGAPGSAQAAAPRAGRLRIERAFPTSGPFYAGDDGALVYAGPCGPDPAGPTPVACARSARGEWRQHALHQDPGASADAGAPLSSADVRWAPRLDRSPLAIVPLDPPETYDPGTEKAQPWRVEDLAGRLRQDVLEAAGPPLRSHTALVDRRWTAGEDGALRGWVRGDGAVEILPGGAVVESPYRLERGALPGAFALARAPEGRTFQSVDHGRTWDELGGPASLIGRPLQLHGCTRVGCDLGAWLRLGWEAPPPSPAPPPAIAPAPPALPSPALPAIACRPAGELRQAAAPLTVKSPTDIGLGARTVPVSGDPVRGTELSVGYFRQPLSRGFLSPPHSTDADADAEIAPRAMLHGYLMDWSGTDSPGPLSGLAVLGPNPSPQSFRRDLTFLEPLDPAGPIRTASFGLGPLLAALGGAGVSPVDMLSSSFEALGVVPVLPADPAGRTELFFSFGGFDPGALAAVTRGAGIDLAWATEVLGVPVSAAALPAGASAGAAPSPRAAGAAGARPDLVTLWVDDVGTVRVQRLSGGALTSLGGLPAPPSADLYPGNPDAVAVGPQGEIAVLRTPSGPEPASADDPALLFPLGGGPPRALAPWSTLTSDADPACRAAPGGHRALVQTARSWVRVGVHVDVRAGEGTAPEAATTPMTARVRWSEARVCLEAIELPVRMTIAGSTLPPTEVLLVARLAPSPAAAEVTVGIGLERRQALSCALAPAQASP